MNVLKLFLNRSEVRIRTKITQILCLQPREQSVHTSKLMPECSDFSRGSLLPISKEKRLWRGMLGFNRKQINTGNGEGGKQNTL